jgi:hypothetical protein
MNLPITLMRCRALAILIMHMEAVLAEVDANERNVFA